MHLLRKSPENSLSVRHFALTVLEHHIAHRWMEHGQVGEGGLPKLSEEEKKSLKNAFLSFLAASFQLVRFAFCFRVHC